MTDPDALQYLEAEITALSKGVQTLLSSTRLKEDVILLLIQQASPPVKGKKPSRATVAAVLEGVSNLEDVFLKKLEE